MQLQSNIFFSVGWQSREIFAIEYFFFTIGYFINHAADIYVDFTSFRDPSWLETYWELKIKKFREQKD